MILAKEKGQGLVEYSLIILLVALAVVVSLGAVGSALGPYYQQVIDAFP